MLFSRGQLYAGLSIVKVGILDGEGVLDECKPDIEMFGKSKVSWAGGYCSVVLDGAYSGVEEDTM